MKQCPRCLNSDPSLFSDRYGEIYCRACVGFLGRLAEVEDYSVGDPHFSMGFELTAKQAEISKRLVEIGLECDVLVEAVCGAGKTEIVLELVKKAIHSGLRVGWMVARRQVVLQLGERLGDMFSDLKVVSVVGGQSDVLVGDLIVLTAHQLYRYPQMFDLMIVDEPDAFPFKGDKTLHGLLEVACKGTKVYLTATPSNDCDFDEHLLLEERPHGRPLVVPTVFKSVKFVCYLRLVMLVRQLKRVLVFVPTIQEAKFVSRLLGSLVITSQSVDKEKIIEKFDKGNEPLVCTTILERGVTFHGVSVVIFNGSHMIFDEASLVQICGRVDRSFTLMKGECHLLCHGYNKSIDLCLSRLKRHNQNAFGV